MDCERTVTVLETSLCARECVPNIVLHEELIQQRHDGMKTSTLVLLSTPLPSPLSSCRGKCRLKNSKAYIVGTQVEGVCDRIGSK